MGFMEDLMKESGRTEIEGTPVNREGAKMLREKLSQISEPIDLKVGDLVVWKKGLKNKRTQGLFIVTEVFDSPLFDPGEKTSGSQYYREPWHGKLGSIAGDGDFLEYHFDFRRFEKVDL